MARLHPAAGTVRTVGGQPRIGIVLAVPWATGRPPTNTESQRRYRAGRRGIKGHVDLTWQERRNGLPFRPYIYRGSGRDAFDGSDLFEEAS